MQPLCDCRFPAGQYSPDRLHSGHILHYRRGSRSTTCLVGDEHRPATGILEVVGQIDVAISIEQRKQIQCAKGLFGIGVERSAHEREVRCSGQGVG